MSVADGGAHLRRAQERGAAAKAGDAYKSMAYSRGASALGVGLALEEIAAPVRDEDVLADWSLHSGVASTSAGIELAPGGRGGDGQFGAGGEASW